MEIADADKDGTISFTEFFFFVLVNQTPTRVIMRDFAKKDGKMNMKDFSKCLT